MFEKGWPSLAKRFLKELVPQVNACMIYITLQLCTERSKQIYTRLTASADMTPDFRVQQPERSGLLCMYMVMYKQENGCKHKISPITGWLPKLQWSKRNMHMDILLFYKAASIYWKVLLNSGPAFRCPTTIFWTLPTHHCNSQFTNFKYHISTLGHCHVWPWLIEFSDVIPSYFTLSRLTVFHRSINHNLQHHF